MRVLVIVKAPPPSEPGVLPANSTDEAAACGPDGPAGRSRR